MLLEELAVKREMSALSTKVEGENVENNLKFAFLTVSVFSEK